MGGSIPRISVVSFTAGPIAASAASLARVRDLATEIVVAVDARVDPETLGPLYAVADRVIRAEYMVPFEANLAWLDSLATGDWVLHLDGDDVVSDALVRRLSTPGWDDGITHARVPYRWIWPTPDRMLDVHPWWPDPVLRLFRTIPGITRYPVGTQMGRTVVGDVRYLEEPLYHLDLVVSPLEVRAAKVDGYERSGPGLRTERGWAVNSTYYLPEERDPAPHTAPVPTADVDAVATVFAAANDPGTNATAGSGAGRDTDRVAERDQVVVTAESRRAPKPRPGEIGLQLVDDEPVVGVAGRPTTITMRFSNRSGRRLGPHDVPPTNIGARMTLADGVRADVELRAALPGPVAPGDDILVHVVVPEFVPVGRLTVDVGAVQEGVAWHDVWCAVAVELRADRRIALVDLPGDDRAADAQLVARIMRAVPSIDPVIVTRRAVLPTEWPVGYEAVVVLSDERFGRSEVVRAARDGGIPVIDGRRWGAASAAQIREILAEHLRPE